MTNATIISIPAMGGNSWRNEKSNWQADINPRDGGQ